MIKGHSAGIGDILRSSAAWRALKNAFPGADLYLLLLTKDPGYVSEAFIARHHLLKGFFVLDKRTKGFSGWMKFLGEIGRIVNSVGPDLVIDFESQGLRTSLLSLWIRARFGICTIGTDEVPGRGLFYSVSSSSRQKFARKRRLPYPLEYTYRDFVALSALRIERNGIPIELEETPEGKRFRHAFRRRFGIRVDAPLLGVNIGCGTEDARTKRPDLSLISGLIGYLQKEYGYTVVLTGAGFEKEINREFISLHTKNFPSEIYELAGETDLIELAGLIGDCRLFISSDSGPYHMAVALRVPTLAVFNFDNRVHFHHEHWVRCVVIKDAHDLQQLKKEADDLIAFTESSSRSAGKSG